jgi:hypothetical protein
VKYQARETGRVGRAPLKLRLELREQNRARGNRALVFGGIRVLCRVEPCSFRGAVTLTPLPPRSLDASPSLLHLFRATPI